MYLREAGDIVEGCVLAFRRISMNGNMPDNTEKECRVVKKINAEELYCKFAALSGFYDCLPKSDISVQGYYKRVGVFCKAKYIRHEFHELTQKG